MIQLPAVVRTHAVILSDHDPLVDLLMNSFVLGDNTRSQGYYDMAEAMHSGELNLLDTFPYADKLRRELGAHHYEAKSNECPMAVAGHICARRCSGYGGVEGLDQGGRRALTGFRRQAIGGVVVPDIQGEGGVQGAAGVNQMLPTSVRAVSMKVSITSLGVVLI
jgi:hypothetical protein